MANIEKANQIIDQIIGGLKLLKETLQDEKPLTAQSVTKAPTSNTESFSDNSFDSLKEALNSPKWPQAVNPNYIIDPNSESDKIERGRGIIEMVITDPLEKTKFLDYGCGEGHCAKAAHSYKTSITVGYDIVDSPAWSTVTEGDAERPLILTTDYNKVVENGPYDVILLYDVLDHTVGEHPENLLKKVSALLKPDGKIYMRCHPYTSRHATHLYHDLNKAYIHLVFSPEELKQLLPESNHAIPNCGVTRPIATYEEWIKKANLTIFFRDETPEPVESFFKLPAVANRIMKSTKFDSFPEYQLSLQFLTYHLIAKPQ